MGEILRSRTLALGLLITLVVVIGIVIGPMVTPFPAEEMDFVNVLTPPDATHWLGTDSYGRDVLSRILSGGRISFLVSFAGVLGGAAIGTAIGMTAAWRGGRWETLMMAGCDLLFAFPSFVLALFMMVVLGFGTQNVILAIGLTYLPIFARLARNLTRTLMPEPYVQAARLMGQGPARILLREILPNILSPLMVQVSVGVAFGIVIEAGLSFLGLGVPITEPSLGLLISNGYEYMLSGKYWISFYPGIALLVTIVSINLVGDHLRDVLNPRLQK